MSAWEGAAARFLARATSERSDLQVEDLRDLQGEATSLIEAHLHQAGCQIQMENDGVSIRHEGPPADAPVSLVLLQAAVSLAMPATASLGVQIAQAALRDLSKEGAVAHPGWQSREAWAACQALQRHAERLSAEIEQALTDQQKRPLAQDLKEVRGALDGLLNRLCDPASLQHVDEAALEWLEELAPWAERTGAVSPSRLKALMTHAAGLALERAISSPSKSDFGAWFKAARSFTEALPCTQGHERAFFALALPRLLDMPAPSAAETWLHEALHGLDADLYLQVARQALLNAADPWRGPMLELPGGDDLLRVDPVLFHRQDRQRVQAVSFQMIRNCEASLAADQEIASDARARAVLGQATQVQAPPNPACEIPCCHLV